MNRTILSTTAILALASAAGAATVFSNNPAPGDVFTNPTTTTTNIFTPGAAVGSSNWFYTNVRNNGVVGIHNAYPRSGNGSARLESLQGPAGNSSKADIEYFHAPNGVLAPMGTLGSLNTLKYDWYRASGGTANADQHAVLRLYIDADGDMNTTNDRGYLIYERAYNGGGAVPTDAWQTDDVFNYFGAGSSANLWQVAFGLGNFDTAGNWQPLSVWTQPGGFTPAPNGRNFNAASAVYGVSLGVGSGWGTYDGAVDNVMIGFTGAPMYSWNFEVVPAPGSLALLGLGGLLAARRRRA
ncbi:MAG: PEP-CTERM sorting domain-containing protein [Phycisphaeraceae bacterium]|nr:PEP-CTERM sorting domain-containing protein [Phycisphaeraceae bacterium]